MMKTSRIPCDLILVGRNDQFEKADRAMELLHKAGKAGYNDAAHMAKDTDLDPLRGREDFKKLLAGLGKK